MYRNEYDAIVVGSGPNGLSAAITMQQQGLSVLLLEGRDSIGGGLRSAELTLPGFMHDVCSAIHPMALTSPFLKTLPLEQFGLSYIHPAADAAHPFDDGTAAVLYSSLEKTAQLLGEDCVTYERLYAPLLKDFPELMAEVLGPLKVPKHPLVMARFGLKALPSALQLARRFKGKAARGLFGGIAAHSIQPLSNAATAAVGLVLSLNSHASGWPVPRGGAQSLANALADHFIYLGGEIQTNTYVKTLSELPPSRAVLLDVTPKQLLSIAGERFTSFYKWQLQRYRYGMGVFKVDWALEAPVPFTAAGCREAGTVHLGNTIEEIAASELQTSRGQHPEKPFVLLAQQSVFDNSRAPKGKHTAWAYCHVPNGSTKDMTAAIEDQVERFAPGFKDLILGRHVMNTAEMESYNPNYIGGDINGGVIDISQLYTRPAIRLSPYSTPAKGIYICSSSTPPGGGVHGMCGYYAARKALKDVFGLRIFLSN
ncbi:MAG TPA: NAD(P)/FAD-dependent oxidoreductase [Chitinophaga sp.]|nr:NAD(P)/FAD-dependent oxidoreductase [Chitinophaga sp.]